MESNWSPDDSLLVTNLLRAILYHGRECPAEVLAAACDLSDMWKCHPFNAPEFYLEESQA